VLFRRLLQPYMEKMARSLATPPPAGVESSQEPSSDDREQVNDVNCSQTRHGLALVSEKPEDVM